MTAGNSNLQVQNQGNVGAAAPSSFPEHGYVCSSGAINFAAFMDLLDSQQKGMEASAKLAAETATVRGDIIAATATATESTFNDDAEQLHQQMFETITQGVTSGIQGAAAGVGLMASRGAGKPVEAMQKISGEVNGLHGEPLGGEVGDDLPQGQALDQRTQILAKYRTQIKTGNFDYSQVHEGGINTKLEGGVTLKQVLLSASADPERGTSAKIEFDKMNKSVGNAKMSAEKAQMHKEQMIQSLSQGANMLTQTFGSIPTAVCKTNEADAMTQKGADSAVQQYAQGSGQIIQDIGSALNQAAQKYQQDMQGTWSNIAANVQVDTKG